MDKDSKQKIASLEAKIARIREKDRKRENGQKIILGAMLLNEARQEPRIRKWLIDTATRTVTRKADVSRLQPLLDELRELGE